MPLSLTSSPPDRTSPWLEEVPEPVRRRHVVYIHGYDAKASRRYRPLFARELARYVSRFALIKERITASGASPDGLRQSWIAKLDAPGWSTTVLYDLLLWEDLVHVDRRRPLLVRMGLLNAGILHSIATLALFRLIAVGPKYGMLMLYPFLTFVALATGAVLLARVLGGFLGGFLDGAMPSILAQGAAFAAAAAVFGGLAVLIDRTVVQELLHGWAFHWRHGNGWRPDYDARVERFAQEVVRRARASDADELLIVGHSTGALTAVEVLARAMELDPTLGRPGQRLALLTIGSAMPMVALNPKAKAVRAAIARLVEDERVTWVDILAPQDWLNFPRFNPARHVRFEVPPKRLVNPFVRSARLREIMRREDYERLLWRPIQLHFQYLSANEHADEYDFFAFTLGPQSLLERVYAPQVTPRRPTPLGAPARAKASGKDPDDARG